MKNESGIHPAGHRVLVLPEQETEDEARLKKVGLVMPGSVTDRHRLAQMAGIVVGIGKTAWLDFKSDPWARIGDRVMFAKYSGVILRGKDGKSYRMVNDEDIVAVLDNEVEVKSGDDA